MSKKLEQKILIGILIVIVLFTIFQSVVQFLQFASIQAYLERLDMDKNKTKYSIEFPISRII